MNREELEEAIRAVLSEIESIKLEIDTIGDGEEKRCLIRRKKELQYLQLWQIEQLESDGLG